MYKVLVADDARVMRFATLRILKKLGLAAVEAEDGLQALELFESEKPDLVLIDVQMPGLDGLEVVRRIRQLSGEHWVPVIFLTSMEDDADFSRGIEAGGDDYLTKPVSPVVLEAKIRAMRRLDDMRRELMAVTLELREANERLARLSQQDGLTGLANRRRFDLDLMREMGRARRERRPIAVVIADVDYFKAFNDTYGHPAGDDCLRRIARRPARHLPPPGRRGRALRRRGVRAHPARHDGGFRPPARHRGDARGGRARDRAPRLGRWRAPSR